MNLRTKLLLGIGIALVVTFAIVAVISVITMEESYRILEEKDVITTASRAGSSILTDEKNLRSVTRDYAAWTDTLRFVKGENDEWVETNTGDDFFNRFGIQGLIVLDTQGRSVFTKGYDAEMETSTDLAPGLLAVVQQTARAHNITGLTDGELIILESGGTLWMVSSHPILTDNFEGPAAGSLHHARKIDARYSADLSARTGRSVGIVPAGELPAGNSAADISQEDGEIPVLVSVTSQDTISGYIPLQNLEIPGEYFLKVSEPRTIYHSGMSALFTFLLTLLGAGLFIIVFVLLFIDRIMLSRLNAIIQTVRTNTENGQGNGETRDSDADELARLALEIDPVFSRLAESRIQLQQSEERYRTLAESAQDFIYIIDENDIILYLNRFAAESVGRTPEALIGKHRSELFPLQESERQYRNIRSVFSTGKPFKIESNLPLPGGERWTDTLLVPLRGRNNEITGVMGITRDITQRKKTEEALAVTNRKLNLLSSITRHDILNQLMALRTYLELSLDYSTDPVLTDIITKEQGIAEVIDEQITFTRDYRQMGVTAPSWQEIDKVIPWTLQPLMTPSVTVSVNCPHLEVFADPMLEKVFYNLVDNAIRYGGKSLSRISIGYTENEDGLDLTVEDNGQGIAPDNKEKIFERGFGQNTGFGLFLSREILAITGMTITETGISGSGARFEILVPKGTYRFTGPDSL